MDCFDPCSNLICRKTGKTDADKVLNNNYAVIWDDGEKIKYSLKDAMEYVEALGGQR